MKTRVLLVVLVLISVATTSAQRGARIAYVDMEYILENVEEYQDATTQLDAKVEKWKLEIEEKQNGIDQMKKDLAAEKVLLTKELVEEREEEILQVENEMLKYQQDRFGPQGDLIVQKRILIQPIQDQVFNAVQELGVNKKYDIIFDKSDVLMLFSNNRHDVSDQILRTIGRTRKLNKNKAKSKKSRSKLDTYVEEESEGVKARKEASKAKQTDREQKAISSRQKKIDEREARKKAYEERRKKLLAEREAKRKAKEEERKAKENKEDNKEEENKTEN